MGDELESIIADEINEFKQLQYLKIKGFYFKIPANFKLYNLKLLNLCDATNINFEEISLSNLKRLDLDRTIIIANNLIELSELEEMIIKESYKEYKYIVFLFVIIASNHYLKIPNC